MEKQKYPTPKVDERNRIREKYTSLMQGETLLDKLRWAEERLKDPELLFWEMHSINMFKWLNKVEIEKEQEKLGEPSINSLTR